MRCDVWVIHDEYIIFLFLWNALSLTITRFAGEGMDGLDGAASFGLLRFN
jgi:hypothetical protein